MQSEETKNNQEKQETNAGSSGFFAFIACIIGVVLIVIHQWYSPIGSVLVSLIAIILSSLNKNKSALDTVSLICSIIVLVIGMIMLIFQGLFFNIVL